MNQEAYDLRGRLREMQDRDSELQRKIEETRELLAKADERRARDRDRQGRWNQIIDNLEASYRMLKQESERSRIAVSQIELELMRLLDVSGQSLSSLDAEIEAAAPAAPMIVEFEDDVLLTPMEDVEDFSGLDGRIGWRDLLHMAVEDLATLTDAEIAQVRACIAPGLNSRITETDRRLVEGRLQLAAELHSARPVEAQELEAGERRRQIILRAAVDKIQHNRAQLMTNEEISAILWCKQRLAAKPQASAAEKRLLRIIEASLGLIRRHRRLGSR